MYNLFLDDCREPQDVTWVALPLVNWTIARSYADFTRIICTLGMPLRLTFDHDLADEHYREYQWAHSEQNFYKGKFNYDKLKEKTGYHCAQWLVEYCMNKGLTIPEYYVHTMNPIGKQNIISVLESYKKSLTLP